MTIKPPDYKYCPFCAGILSVRIEENRERKYCPKCGWRHFPSPAIAVAAVIIEQDKVLLVQRNRDPHKGTWMFPAGFVEYGEDLPEALAREVKEETGLTAIKAKLIRAFQSKDDPRDPAHFVLFYWVKTLGEIKNQDPEENREVDWFEIANPPKIGWASHKFIMAMLKLQKKGGAGGA